MEIMPTARIVLYLVTAFYIMTATSSLVTAAPTTTSSTPATITTSPAGMNGNPAVITFNQSQCPDPTNAASQVNEAKDSLCYGHFLADRVIGNALKNIMVEQCSNYSLSIMDVLTNMISVTCRPGVKLHILASVLKTYHSMAVQVATATDTDELTRTQMQTISEILRGLILNYFRVISPDHCSCSNARGCVSIVDMTDMLNLSYLTSNCSLGSYISQHLLNDHKKIYEGYTDHKSCRLGGYALKCSRWIEEYILPYSPSSIPIC